MSMENNKYFKVVCKCGHVGKKFFVRVAFPIEAIDGKNAANIARFLPRVKHDYEDAILSCERITFEEFQRLKVQNQNDPYLKCTNVQDQNMIHDFESRLEVEERYLKKEQTKTNKRDSAKYRFRKQSFRELDYDKEYLYI